MKKFLFLAAMLLLACLPLTSCGGDDEPKNDVTTTATYMLTFSQDLLDACQGTDGGIFITYKGKNGENVKTAIEKGKTTWTQTVTSGFPAEYGVRFEFSYNSEGLEKLTKETYNLICNMTFKVKTSDGRINNYERNEPIINQENVAKRDLKKVLDANKKSSKGWRVSADYNVTSADNLNYD